MNKSQLKAIGIAKQVFKNLIVAPGLKEKEVADQIKQKLKEYRAQPAFRIIVASGKRSAKPHGFATNKIIRRGELVVIDFGARYNGYCSDITRTFIVGKPTSKQRKIYQIVKEAQQRAIKAVRPGKVVKAVDEAARDYIKQKGWGRYFIHNTGHGIGKKVHQAPKVSKRNRNRLRKGMVITIEPGIYIKGWGGVRVEDMVLVTKRGCQILTSQ